MPPSRCAATPLQVISTLWSDGHVAVIPILPADEAMLQHRMADVLQLPEVRSRLGQGSGAVLAYLVPKEYIMQGMIADTDPAWRIYEHHQTLAMITDWIIHPFRHLEGGHSMMHHARSGPAAGAPSSPTGRRLIFLRVQTGRTMESLASLFNINPARTPNYSLTSTCTSWRYCRSRIWAREPVGALFRPRCSDARTRTSPPHLAQNVQGRI